ncbi:MAG: 50S ribosomal protein L10 [bacterium]|nr:50S ribosomal protein L10 [bacterium]
MNRADKAEVVSTYRQKFSEAKIGVLAGYRGMSVAEISELRGKLREASAELKVVKNNLARIAAEGTPMEPLKDHFKGPMAIALSYDDVAAPAKILSDAAKQYKHLEVMSGALDGALLDQSEIARIATLPSRDELLGMFLRVLQAPVTSFATVLTAPLRDLVGVLNGVKEKKEA